MSTQEQETLNKEEQAEQAEQAEAAEQQAQEEAAQPQAEETEPNWQEAYMRKAAELDNFRKQAKKRQDEALRLEREQMLVKVLPVVDDLVMGTQAAQQVEDLEKLRESLAKTEKVTFKKLEKLGLKPIEAEGTKFDSELHEALNTMPAEEGEEKGIVKQVFEMGWYYNDKVIRPAKVVVTG